MLDECFAAEDDRFLDELCKFNSHQFLVTFVERWIDDNRDWARQQIVKYLCLEMNIPGHQIVYKRLFKHFEKNKDHEIMGVFMFALDRIVRRRRIESYHWDYQSRRSFHTESLFAKPNETVVDNINRSATATYRGRTISYPLPDILNRADNRMFSHRTRNHLRRRVWRYFRQLSFVEPQIYVSEISSALSRYLDDDLAVGENILDNWSLMHACYFHHPGITFTQNHANLTDGAALDALTPAPYQADAWKSDNAANSLVNLIYSAESSLVRIWAMEMLQSIHPRRIGQIDVSVLVQMLCHHDSRVQEFAVELFRKHDSLSKLPLETWISLLNESDPSVLATLCEAMKTHVIPERLKTSQIIQLACSQQVPVAALGFLMLQERSLVQPLTVEEIKSLSSPKCDAIAGEITLWAMERLSGDNYAADHVLEFLDSLIESVRAAAMKWLLDSRSDGYNDPVVWTKLMETPFDDIRIPMIESLHVRSRLPGQNSQSLVPLWTSIILNIQRGNRTKLKAVRQVSDQIGKDHGLADSLFPILVIAVRSIRGPEQRNALATIVTLGIQHPKLLNSIKHHLPELEWVQMEDAV